jgi:hypothetical protein
MAQGPEEVEADMAEADEANGEGRAEEPINETEDRYGHDESPA